MQKAAEHGAVRAEVYGDEVTHLIIDSRCSFQEVLNALNRDNLPERISVVNEYFAPECIEFGYLLSPAQKRFAVRGHVPLPQPAPALMVREVEVKMTGERKEPGESHYTENPQNAHDTLDEAIATIRQAAALPISPDDSSEAESEAADLPNREPSASVSASAPHWQSAFQCMRSHPLPSSTSTSTASNPNAPTIAILQQMQSYYSRTNDTWRTLSYQRAISSLRNHSTPVTTRTQALAIPGIGERLATKIEEIATTQSLRRLEHAEADPHDQARRLFTGVYGAGPAQAQSWIARGYRTLEDLRSSGELTRTQQVGVERYTDFNSRISRDEVKRHGELVEGTVRELLEPAGDVEVIIGGSYRRGKKSSGDIDFLVIGSEDMTLRILQGFVFERLVPRLWQRGYLKCALAACHTGEDYEDTMDASSASPRTKPAPSSSRASKESGSFSKWHGAAALPPSSDSASEVWRRVDFLVVPANERGAALLYFTGSALFNRSMRLLARKRGMRLNQRGLWARPTSAGTKMGKKTDEQMVDGKLMEALDEHRIFEILDVPWREAWERNC
jgi:DNA polymerase IV